MSTERVIGVVEGYTISEIDEGSATCGRADQLGPCKNIASPERIWVTSTHVVFSHTLTGPSVPCEVLDALLKLRSDRKSE